MDKTLPGRSRWKRLGRGLLIGLLLLVVLLAAGAVWVRSRVLASLPQLEGTIMVSGLASDVTIKRDALGVPTIHASNRLDLARATGFLHGQDRFFQIDLLRRQSAGELAELFGSGVMFLDKQNRVHQFRSRAIRALEHLSDFERQTLHAYADGVNSGLTSLGAWPPEYYALRVDPVDWRPEDSLLVVFSMYLELQGDNGIREASLGCMHDLYPRELFNFLTQPDRVW